MSKGDFVVWNLAFWVATMHSVELGLGSSIGASVLFVVFRNIATKLKHKGVDVITCREPFQPVFANKI